MLGINRSNLGVVSLVAFLVIAPPVIWATTSGDGGSTSSDISAQRGNGFGGDSEITVTIAERLNNAETSRGKKRVPLECVNGDGKVVTQAVQNWPLPNDAEASGPHAHLLVPPEELNTVELCRFLGTKPKLQARVE